MTAPPMMMAAPTAQRTSKPTIAGVFCILGVLASLIGLIVALVLAALFAGLGGMAMPFGSMFGSSVAIVLIMGLVGMIGGVMGAMFSFQRKKWMMALVGTILLLVTGHVLTGIIALILVAISKKEFAS